MRVSGVCAWRCGVVSVAAACVCARARARVYVGLSFFHVLVNLRFQLRPYVRYCHHWSPIWIRQQ